tara:strand:+ start:42 stop:215 length:174 start_codon:yes stop_codon:yes gene_type:complete
MKVWNIKSNESGWYVADATRDLDEVLSSNQLEGYEISIVEQVEYDEETMKRFYEETA